MNTYFQSGVNLEAASDFVSGVSQIAKRTFNSSVIGGIGGFAGLFKLPNNYQSPVLVACTDGVGTKLKLAYENNYLKYIGQDLVAMCLNDLLCTGAKPLFFLDYLATENLKPSQALLIAESIAQACTECQTVLLGGETAELPNMLPSNAYELAGFAVGLVEEKQILKPDKAAEGDILIALPSSGAHSNGYSLIRAIIEKQNLNLNQIYANFDACLLEEIMKPTYLYQSVLDQVLPKIKSMAHITGGGLPENLPRAFDANNLMAIVQKKSWQIPNLFNFLQEQGQIEEDEMFKVFNMGIGLVLIISPTEKKNICDHLRNKNQAYFEIGHLVKKANSEFPSFILQ